MGITFNAFEIFEMAEQVERNGVKFYRRAAEIFAEQEISQTLLELADMEVEHEQTFAEMRKQLSANQRELVAFDLDNKAALDLQAIAGGHVFNLKKDMSEQLTGDESIADVLKMAIQAEKISVTFYSALMKFVPEAAGKDRIEAIIKEENGHVALLNRKLSDVKA